MGRPRLQVGASPYTLVCHQGIDLAARATDRRMEVFAVENVNEVSSNRAPIRGAAPGDLTEQTGVASSRIKDNHAAPCPAETVVYRIKPSVEAFPLDSSSAIPKYVLTTGNGKSYVVSEKLKDILLLFDGKRSLGEIAEEVSKSERAAVSEEQIRQVVSQYLACYGLLEEVNPLPAPEAQAPEAAAKATKPFDFIFRFPLFSPRMISPVVDRLTWLFNQRVAVAAIAAITFTHLALYQDWFLARQPLSLAPGQVLILYALVIATVLFHELGHAAACKAYRCEHGAIGVCLYLIFPAFYINLSNAWRLPRRQRAVIDLGGIYFHLLATIPLFLLYLTTQSPYFCAAIYSIDLMALLSLNPVFKFDGYWLLVDLSGLVNLQRRGLRAVKETFLWAVGLASTIPILAEIPSLSKRVLLISYSLLVIIVFAGFFVLLMVMAPSQVAHLGQSLSELFSSLNKGFTQTLVNAAKVLGSLFFFFLLYRFFSQTVLRLRKKAAVGKPS